LEEEHLVERTGLAVAAAVGDRHGAIRLVPVPLDDAAGAEFVKSNDVVVGVLQEEVGLGAGAEVVAGDQLVEVVRPVDVLPLGRPRARRERASAPAAAQPTGRSRRCGCCSCTNGRSNHRRSSTWEACR